MNVETQIWLFGVIGFWLLSLTSVVWWSKGEVKTMRLAMKLFIDGMGKAAVEVLHSPDDHLGLDVFLDKYKAGHFDMSNEDWITFKERCDRLQNDSSISAAERMAAATILAAFAAQVALHKIQRIPPEVLQRIKQ